MIVQKKGQLQNYQYRNYCDFFLVYANAVSRYLTMGLPDSFRTGGKQEGK